MAIKKKGLGKGLDSMFPSYGIQSAKSKSETDNETAVEKEKAKSGLAAEGRKSTDKTKSQKNQGSRSKETGKKKTAETDTIETKTIEEAEIAEAETVVEAEEAEVAEAETVDEAEKAESVEIETPDETESAVKKSIVTLKISEVEPNRQQPRKEFNEDALLELAESVRQYGVIQPLIVQKRDDYYEIIAGERRWRAAKLAGLKEVPVVIKDYTEQEIMEVSLIENIQREDLNPIEEAKAYQRLLDEYGLKQDELAEKIAKNRTTITNALRLLKLDPRVRQMLIDEMLTTGHARALLAISDLDGQYDAAQLIFEQKLSVRETEKLVKRLVNPPVEKEAPKNQGEEALDLICREIENQMKDILGTKVSVKRKDNQKGRVEIEYYSSEELERIYEMIRSIRNI